MSHSAFSKYELPALTRELRLILSFLKDSFMTRPSFINTFSAYIGRQKICYVVSDYIK